MPISYIGFWVFLFLLTKLPLNIKKNFQVGLTNVTMHGQSVTHPPLPDSIVVPHVQGPAKQVFSRGVASLQTKCPRERSRSTHEKK